MGNIEDNTTQLTVSKLYRPNTVSLGYIQEYTVEPVYKDHTGPRNVVCVDRWSTQWCSSVVRNYVLDRSIVVTWDRWYLCGWS